MKELIPHHNVIVIHMEEITPKKKELIVSPEAKTINKVHWLSKELEDKLAIGDIVLLNSNHNLFKLDPEFGENLFITNYENVVGVIKEVK